jgi:uroporphyrin-III C-methyltransferase/precorrin-2 dehydrogenase/sirohydrochlorin ferrochelatase
MRVFLASIPLDNRSAVVVGGGEMAVAKARLMSKTPATLRWFAPDGASPETLAEAARITSTPVETRLPVRADFEGAALAFIALDDSETAIAVAAEARAAGALVNVVDRPELSDFHTPALIDRGEVVVGIATGGSAPILARDVRARVEAALPDSLGVLAGLAGAIRDTVKATIPNALARRRFWERAFRGRAADLATAGDTSGARREMLRLLNAGAPPQGVVWLVGAGPGDPELLTLKALRVLQDADVIVHDRLVSEGVLDHARRDARRIYVGKAKGDHAVPQREIESILIEEARRGQRVVRLKGGDPFVFGRGGEELEALREAGIETHVIPGITAALACAASAGLPLTHRDHAQAVTFVTGQSKPGEAEVDWAALSSAQHTLAVYMGVGQANRISERLIEAGRDPLTPVTVVVNGALPEERIVSGRLFELDLLTAVHAVEGPAMLFIGKTAALAAAQSIQLVGAAA